MKDEYGRIVEGEDEVLKVMEKLGRSSENNVVPDTEVEDVGRCELGMCDQKMGRSGAGLEMLEEREGSYPWWNFK